MLDKWWPYVCLSPHRWLCIFSQEKAESGTYSPPPNPLLLLPLPLSLHQSFVARPFYFSPLLCRRLDIGNTVSAFQGNNSGKRDINYLPIAWHMQGIVLAIIVSTLSPEGMNGAIAALCLSVEPLELFIAPAFCNIKSSTHKSFKLEEGRMAEWISLWLIFNAKIINLSNI